MINYDRIKSVADITRYHAEVAPDAVAQVFQDHETTYGALDAAANRAANGLISLGCKPGTRIGFLGRNSGAYFEMLCGAIKARTVVVGVNWRLAPPEVTYVFGDAGVEVLFVGRDFYGLVGQIKDDCPALRQIIAMDGGHETWPAFTAWRDGFAEADPMLPNDPDDDVIQLYTSGTTGHPKGVQLTNANYMEVLRQGTEAGWADWNEGEANLLCMPLFHVAGVNVGLIGFAHGCRNIIVPDVDPAEIVRLIEAHGIAIAFMVPAVILFVTLLPDIEKADLSSVRLVIYGASPIAEDLLLRAQEVFKSDFIQVYGLTETTGGGTILDPEDHDPARGKLRSCGKPAPGVDVRTLDEDGNKTPVGEVGEIVIRSACVMKGYWNRPGPTAEAVTDGWFHTGDAGYFDDEGYLFIYDRVKDMIVSGGENVYPAEVENALFSHPAVADAAVIGVPSERWGEEVKAIVVRKPDTEVSVEDLIAHARTRIAGYKIPKSVDFAAALPRNPSGKVLRRELRAPFWEGRERRVG